jgi:hypothetical protein
MSRNLKEELEREDEESIENWSPDVGDVLVGTVLRYERRTTKKGQYCTVVVREEKTKEPIRIWLWHKVLAQKFSEQKPKPGERIGVKRLANSPKGYYRYLLKVDRESDEQVPDYFESNSVQKEQTQEQEEPLSASFEGIDSDELELLF